MGTPDKPEADEEQSEEEVKEIPFAFIPAIKISNPSKTEKLLEKHITMVTTIMNLGILYQRSGYLYQAKEMCQKALTLLRTAEDAIIRSNNEGLQIFCFHELLKERRESLQALLQKLEQETESDG